MWHSNTTNIPSVSKLKESEVAQSCLTLCDPMDCSLPGSSLHGILQAGILEWVAISFSIKADPRPNFSLEDKGFISLWAIPSVLLNEKQGCGREDLSVTQSLCFVKRTLKHAVCMLRLFSHVQLFATLVAHQFPLSMGFSRQEYWSGLHSPSPGDLPNPWIKHAPLMPPTICRRYVIRYADDTTLMIGREEELKSLLMKVKEKNEKAGLKFNIQKT